MSHYRWGFLRLQPIPFHSQSACIVLCFQPGDALFIPCGWWHQVDSTGELQNEGPLGGTGE